MISKVVENMTNIDDITLELVNYRTREGFSDKDFVWRAVEKLQFTMWWKTFYHQTDLGKFAIRILITPSTSASVELSFSAYGTHKKRQTCNYEGWKTMLYRLELEIHSLPPYESED